MVVRRSIFTVSLPDPGVSLPAASALHFVFAFLQLHGNSCEVDRFQGGLCCAQAQEPNGEQDRCFQGSCRSR